MIEYNKISPRLQFIDEKKEPDHGEAEGIKYIPNNQSTGNNTKKTFYSWNITVPCNFPDTSKPSAIFVPLSDDQLKARDKSESLNKNTHEYSQTNTAITSETAANISTHVYADTAKTPMNFIWFGSVIPDKFLQNVLEWAQAYPNRLIIIWINEDILTTQEHRQMNRLNKDNIRVLDIGKNTTLENQRMLNVKKWLFDDIAKMDKAQKTTSFALASDIYRLALMYFGSETIKQMLEETDPYKNIISGTSMIYFDTDINLNEVGGVNDGLFEGALLTSSRNDIYAASKKELDYFNCFLDRVLNHTEGVMKKQPLIDFLRQHEWNGIMEFSFSKVKDLNKEHFSTNIPFPFKNNRFLCFTVSWRDGTALDMQRSMLSDSNKEQISSGIST